MKYFKLFFNYLCITYMNNNIQIKLKELLKDIKPLKVTIVKGKLKYLNKVKD